MNHFPLFIEAAGYPITSLPTRTNSVGELCRINIADISSCVEVSIYDLINAQVFHDLIPAALTTDPAAAEKRIAAFVEDYGTSCLRVVLISRGGYYLRATFDDVLVAFRWFKNNPECYVVNLDELPTQDTGLPE